MDSLLKLSTEQVLDTTFDDLRLVTVNTFYPTQASYLFSDGTLIGQCARKVYLEKTGVSPSKLSARAYRIFDFGNIFEEHEINNYKKLGVYVKDHVKFGFPFGKDMNLLLSGEADVIAKIDDKYIGVELKTSYGHSFISQHIKGYKRNPKKNDQYHIIDPLQSAPKAEHLLQVALYLYFFDVYAPKNGIATKISDWRIIYMARDMLIGAEYKVWLEEVSGDYVVKTKKIFSTEVGDMNEDIKLRDIYVGGILNRYEFIYEHIKNKIVPTSEYSINDDWQCKYCKYLDLCKSIGSNSVPDMLDVARQRHV
jgi:hypothetical protein